MAMGPRHLHKVAYGQRQACIWSSRNKYVHREEQYKPLGSMNLIEEQLALLELPSPQLARVKGVPRWERPPVDWSLVNTDGSLNSSTSEAGSGYVLRNDMAEFVEAGCRKHAHVDDPLVSKLLACREGLEAAVRLGIPKLIIQIDCSSIVDMWKEKKEPRFMGAHIIKEMKRARKKEAEKKKKKGKEFPHTTHPHRRLSFSSSSCSSPSAAPNPRRPAAGSARGSSPLRPPSPPWPRYQIRGSAPPIRRPAARAAWGDPAQLGIGLARSGGLLFAG